MTGDELWQARVFGSAAARGSCTGVVLPGGAGTPPSLASLAGELGYPVTVFLVAEPLKPGWNALAFTQRGSPASPVQALLAAEQVLRRRDQGEGFGFQLQAHRFPVRRRPESPWDVAWVELPRPGPLAQPLAPLASALGRDPPGTFPEWVVPPLPGEDRARYVREVADPAGLEVLALTRRQAWSYLRHEGLAEVCLYAWTGPAELSLRVFSAALNGGESACSGEAVAALLPCLLATDPPLRTRPLHLKVQQGIGPPRQRGTLFLRNLPGESTVGVGGRVRLLTHGHLLPAEEAKPDLRVAG